MANVDGINPALYANVIPFRPAQQPAPAAPTETGAAVQPVDHASMARGPERRAVGTEVKSIASAAARSASEVAAMQMAYGLGPGLRNTLPRITNG